MSATKDTLLKRFPHAKSHDLDRLSTIWDEVVCAIIENMLDYSDQHITGQEISLGFHIFVYNIEIRREQPSTAVDRASKGTGYDFFCHDRVEFEDTYRPSDMMNKIDPCCGGGKVK